jgi:GntR family transcriptional regulator, rspAB operon transcriptional repressor
MSNGDFRLKANVKNQHAAPKKLPLTDAAYAALKRHILTGVFAPGQYLNENEIADRLKIGRTPVHQALQRLHLEGLVKIVPRKGIIIQHDSVGKILEILNARILIEPVLVQQAVTNATKDDIIDLERTLLRTKRNPSIDFFIDKDRAFHARLVGLAGNKMLTDFVGMLHERSIRYLMLQMWHTSEASQRADEDHKAIVIAMKKKDASAAGRAMRRHLDGIKDRLKTLAN